MAQVESHSGMHVSCTGKARECAQRRCSDCMQRFSACLGWQVGAEEGVGAAQDEIVHNGAQFTAALCPLGYHLLGGVGLTPCHNGALLECIRKLNYQT